jgi:rhodanese-related sulfurtransferase
MAAKPSPTKPSKVLGTPAAPPTEARAHFTQKLAFETDPSDVHADLQNGHKGFVVLDARSPASFDAEHIPGAINLHYAVMDETTTARLDKSQVVVVYCAGVHCNASTKGAQRLSALGFRVKEMLHGLEGWKMEGYPVEGSGARAKITTTLTR